MHVGFFHLGPGDVLLFPKWILHGRKETYLSCILIVVLGICYQGIKFARQQYGRRCKNMDCKFSIMSSLGVLFMMDGDRGRRYILNKGHLLQTLMYILQFIWGYIIMLSVMSYNVWIMTAVLIGYGLGYFFFGWGEYEEPTAAHILHRVPECRSGFKSCGQKVTLTSSNSTTQQLLPLQDSNTDVHFKGDDSDSIRCLCDNSKL